MKEKLIFGKGNAKLDKSIYTFSLPAGHTCPFANECFSKANKNTGRLEDGKAMKFRCFSASAENLYPTVRRSRWKNYDILKGKSIEEMVEIIKNSLPKNAKMIRLHVSGDFFSSLYFRAWALVAKDNPNIIFYGYTKSLPFWIAYKHLVPSNFKLTASIGGMKDNLVNLFSLKNARVVFTEEEAKKLKLEIDHDDSHAYKGDKSFALLLHGVQPPGTLASKALSELKRKKIKHSYSKK